MCLTRFIYLFAEISRTYFIVQFLGHPVFHRDLLFAAQIWRSTGRHQAEHSTRVDTAQPWFTPHHESDWHLLLHVHHEGRKLGVHTGTPERGQGGPVYASRVHQSSCTRRQLPVLEGHQRHCDSRYECKFNMFHLFVFRHWRNRWRFHGGESIRFSGAGTVKKLEQIGHPIKSSNLHPKSSKIYV